MRARPPPRVSSTSHVMLFGWARLSAKHRNRPLTSLLPRVPPLITLTPDRPPWSSLHTPISPLLSFIYPHQLNHQPCLVSPDPAQHCGVPRMHGCSTTPQQEESSRDRVNKPVVPARLARQTPLATVADHWFLSQPTHYRYRFTTTAKKCEYSLPRSPTPLTPTHQCHCSPQG